MEPASTTAPGSRGHRPQAPGHRRDGRPPGRRRPHGQARRGPPPLPAGFRQSRRRGHIAGTVLWTVRRIRRRRRYRASMRSCPYNIRACLSARLIQPPVTRLPLAGAHLYSSPCQGEAGRGWSPNGPARQDSVIPPLSRGQAPRSIDPSFPLIGPSFPLIDPSFPRKRESVPTISGFPPSQE